MIVLGATPVEVTFTDAEGERARHSWNVTVLSNDAPEIDSYSPRDRSFTVDVGDTERFSATASDVDDNLTGVEWTLDGRRQDDDDFSPTGRHESNHSVTFDRSGSHTVEVTFTGRQGREGQPLLERDGPLEQRSRDRQLLSS